MISVICYIQPWGQTRRVPQRAPLNCALNNNNNNNNPHIRLFNLTYFQLNCGTTCVWNHENPLLSLTEHGKHVFKHARLTAFRPRLETKIHNRDTIWRRVQWCLCDHRSLLSYFLWFVIPPVLETNSTSGFKHYISSLQSCSGKFFLFLTACQSRDWKLIIFFSFFRHPLN